MKEERKKKKMAEIEYWTEHKKRNSIQAYQFKPISKERQSLNTTLQKLSQSMKMT